MNIKTITSPHRRDFCAIYQCEHCGDEQEGRWYDDAYFHNNVIPNMVCVRCNKTASTEYIPLAPKYAASVVI